MNQPGTPTVRLCTASPDTPPKQHSSKPLRASVPSLGPGVQLHHRLVCTKRDAGSSHCMSPSVSSNAAGPSGHATIPALRKPHYIDACARRSQFREDLRDARDAHIIFEAVRLNILPLITRRLTATERDQLSSGNVFVWEEAEHKQGALPRQPSLNSSSTGCPTGGLERWTDGRRWFVMVYTCHIGLT